MANSFLVLLSLLFIHSGLAAGVDRLYSESYLGEKRLDSYAGRYEPLIFQDLYQGKMSFEDEVFNQHFFQPYLFNLEKDYSFFFRSELNGALSCPNEVLSEHFDEIQYSYRLITLSYLMEAQWHMNLVGQSLKLKNSCEFNLQKWLETCRPKSQNMKKFLTKLKTFNPRYEESMPRDYRMADWMKEFDSKKFKWYSHYRMNKTCISGCTEAEVVSRMKKSCEDDQNLMTLICSEIDEIHGLSTQRNAFYLLGISNIINTFNRRGEAQGCLRRFSESLSHKESRYESLEQLFPAIQSFLSQKYKERYLQGRVFFYGSGQEFENKGLTNIYVEEQDLKIDSMTKGSIAPTIATEVQDSKPKKVEVAEVFPKKTVKEVPVRELRKSAFLQSSEIRVAQNLDRAEVDMMKLKYDFVFSLNMINSLSEKLKTFMLRESLYEMQTYDKLGTTEGPVPLLFLKFMIDMQEHQGLWNIILVLGDKFYVSNEIDSQHGAPKELIQLVNNESTGRQWQIYILKP